MTYFTARDIAGITIFAALWGILNATLSPVFFRIFHLPFLCDLIGFASIILAVWWVEKIGTATSVGIIATIINFMFRPTAMHFLGFLATSIVFDLLSFASGYTRLFEQRILGSILLTAISIASAAVAGLLIGVFFMSPTSLQRWGGVLGWAGLHSIGGIIGGIVGVFLMNALISRGVTPSKMTRKEEKD